MASFTRRAIKESFMKLLEERPLNQITVKDIVEDCGVNRYSFYYHFEDIPALIDEIITEDTDSIIRQYSGVDSIEDCLKAAVRFAHNRKRAILHLYRSANKDMVEQYLIKICDYTVKSYMEKSFSDVRISEDDRELITRFCRCECFGQTIEWLNSGMSYDVEAQFGRLCELLHGMVEALIERCAVK